jgi:ElaB/YqjD/DUF883 family membrane-anchored ribosome-binding protein
MDAVCSKHPPIPTTATVDDDESDSCMKRCVEVLGYLNDDKIAITASNHVLSSESFCRLSQMVNPPQEDADRMVSAILKQMTDDKPLPSTAAATEGSEKSGQKEMIDIFNKLFPAEGAKIDASDDQATIRSKIDTAIKDTQQQLAAAYSSNPEERNRALESAREKMTSHEETVIRRIEEVVDDESRWSTAVRE